MPRTTALRTTAIRSAIATGCISLALGVTACQSNQSARPRVAAASTQATQDGFGRIKALAGEWSMVGEDGKLGQEKIVFSVSSNGSVVREIMFPGSQHEMTNLYHLDGDSLVMTHYCAIGNQPRMRAHAASGSDALDFRFDSVTNYAGGEQTVMGGMRLVWVSPDTIRQEWSHFGAKAADPKEQHAIFTFKKTG